MRYKWLNKNNNKNLILFFNGWGMDEGIVKHLETENFDVLMFFDYNTIDTNFDFNILKEYAKVNLIAWSMGVMIGSIFADKISNLNKAVAINGTLLPIDKDYGINPKIYSLTINGFDKNGKEKFMANMFETETNICVSRDLENQKSELRALLNYKSNTNFKYNKVLISSNDKIIPTKSQCNFWNMQPNLKSGHCPFFMFNRWGELL